MIEGLRQALIEQAQTGRPIAYGELARRLALQPPYTIHRLTASLEGLMEEDAAAGRPLLAALAGSKTAQGLPGPGFFLKARALGLYSGNPHGPDAAAFFADELRRAVSHYGARAKGVER